MSFASVLLSFLSFLKINPWEVLSLFIIYFVFYFGIVEYCNEIYGTIVEYCNVIYGTILLFISHHTAKKYISKYFNYLGFVTIWCDITKCYLSVFCVKVYLLILTGHHTAQKVILNYLKNVF